MKIKHKFLLMLAATGAAFCLGLAPSAAQHPAYAHQVYDISQWQGRLNNNQVRSLKHEVPFVILRAQNGGLYQDTQFSHNAYLMHHNRLPYGVYSYSLARTPQQASGEAASLVHRAPQADFYVDDVESMNRNAHIARSARAWADKVHSLTNRPAILYSYSSFVNEHLRPAISAYNGVWLAQYSGYAPATNYHYDLWQFTDNHYSRALRQHLDDSTFPRNARPLSFWIGKHGNRMRITPMRSKRRRARKPRRTITVRRRARKHVRKSNRRTIRPRVHASYVDFGGTDLSKYVSKDFYDSPNVRQFKVISPRGLDLYSLDTGRKVGHLNPGSVIGHDSYQLFYRRRHGLITRSVKFYQGHNVTYTDNKADVQAV